MFYGNWGSESQGFFSRVILVFKVIEEARRVLEIESGKRDDFMEACVGRLKEDLEILLYFGIHKGLNHPKSPKISKLTK